MTEEIHRKIREKMRECGIWNYAINMKIYTTDEFITEFGDKMPEDLINLLKTNVGRLQYYMDERILEPLS